MSTPHWMERLKQRWNLGSVGQVVVVLTVFACTGITVFLIKPPILRLLAGGYEQTTTATIVYYILILPLYNVLLLAYGFVFGQFNFFWEFERRTFKRIFSKFNKRDKN